MEILNVIFIIVLVVFGMIVAGVIVAKVVELFETPYWKREVRKILDATSPQYLETTLATRNPGSAAQAGSVFAKTQTLKSLQKANWQFHESDAVKSPAMAFTAKIPGTLGIIELSKLPGSTQVRFQLSHGGTGGKSKKAVEVIAVFDNQLAKTEVSTLIAGPHEGKVVMWTIHPGEPVSLGDEILIETVQARHPTMTGTVEQALALGFVIAKRVEKL